MTSLVTGCSGTIKNGQPSEVCPHQVGGVDQTTKRDADARMEGLTPMNKHPRAPPLPLQMHRLGQSLRDAPSLSGTEYMAVVLQH